MEDAERVEFHNCFGLCNFFDWGIIRETCFYERNFTIEYSGALYGRLGKDVAGGAGAALSAMLQDGGGFYGDE
jgi:hypothetical protein